MIAQPLFCARLIRAAANLGAAHYWLVVDGLVVDITADQFNDRLEMDAFVPVIVAPIDELPRHMPDVEVGRFVPPSGDWAQAFRNAPTDWQEAS